MKRAFLIALLLCLTSLVPSFVLANELCDIFYSSGSLLRSPILHSIHESAAQITTREIGMTRNIMIEALRKDPHYRWIAELLLDNQLKFAMNRGELSRDGIAKVGFLSYFESDRSSTDMSQKERTDLEAAMSGMSAKKYKDLVPKEERPLYGYLAPPLESPIKREDEVQGYGTDTYIFKTDRMSPIATWTIGDSLDRPLPVSRSGRYLKVPRFHRFLPWDYRDLMLPRLRAYEPNETPENLSLQDFSTLVTLPNGKEVQYNAGTDHGYIEIQFWRQRNQSITLDDVEAFIFKDNPPSGEFLKELKRRGIKIYHNTSGRYDSEGVDKEWSP